MSVRLYNTRVVDRRHNNIITYTRSPQTTFLNDTIIITVTQWLYDIIIIYFITIIIIMRCTMYVYYYNNGYVDACRVVY